jgi:hypothetical protein
MLNKLLLALLLGFVASSHLGATDLVIVCSSASEENCANPPDTECADKPCTSPNQGPFGTCSDIETDFQTGIYNSHTPVPPGAPGKDWLTFTGDTVCALARSCHHDCELRFNQPFLLYCKSNNAPTNPYTPSLIKKKFVLQHDCIGPNEGGEN